MGMTVEEIRAAVEEKKQQALLDSLLQPSEVQYDFPEDKSFEGQLKHLAEQRDTAGIGQRAHREIGGSGITDILNARPDFMPLLEGLYGLGKGAMSTITEGVRGVGEGIMEIPHAQSPYSERGATHPEQMYEQLPGYAKLGSQMGYVAARYPHGIVSFLSESANMMLSPEQYKQEGRPEPTRGNLLEDNLYGIVQMIKDVPAQAYFQARAGLGATPPKWEMDMLGGTEAVNRLYEAPEAFGYGLLMARGGLKAGKRLAKGKPTDVAREVAQAEEKGRTIKAYEKQEAQVERIKRKIGEDYYNIKLYKNTGKEGLPAEVNDIIIDLRKDIINKYFETELVSKVGPKEAWEMTRDEYIYSRPRPALRPYEIRIASDNLTTQSGSVFHGTSLPTMKNILKSGSIRPMISRGDKLSQSVVSMSKYKEAADNFGQVTIELKDRAYKDRPDAVKGDWIEGLEVLSEKPISISDIKKIHIEIGAKETLEWTDPMSGISFNEIIRLAKERNIPISTKQIKTHKQSVEQALSEGKPVPKSVLKDFPEFEHRSLERELADKGDSWHKTLAAEARRGWTNKDILMRHHWMTPRRIIPEIYYPLEKVTKLKFEEEAQVAEVRTGLLKPLKDKNRSGQEIADFLDSHTTEEVGQYLSGERVGLIYKGAVYEKGTSGKWRQIRKSDTGRVIKDKDGKPLVEWIDNPEMIAELDGKLGRGSNRWLSPEELKLAGFDRALTDMLQMRGGLKVEKYIDRYTTWLRDVITEVPEESPDPFSMFTGVQDALPFLKTKVFNRFMESRTEKKAPPRLNVNESIPLYTHVMLKKIYLEPVLKELKPVYDALPHNKQRYANSWLNIIRGRKERGGLAKGIDDLRHSIPWLGKRTKPHLYDRATRRLMGAYYHSMLGLAIDSAIKNMTQVGLTYTKTDMPSMLGGLKDVFTDRYKEPRQMRVLEEFQQIFERPDMPLYGIGKKLADINMTPFQWAEVWNRGLTYYAAKRYFLSKGKPALLSHENAMSFVKRRAADFAKIIDKDTQFEYGRMGTAPSLQGPTVRLFGQFTSFPLKLIETTMNWGKHDKRALMRYISLMGIMSMTASQLGYDWSEVFGTKILPTGGQVRKGLSPAGQATYNLIVGAGTDVEKGLYLGAAEKVLEEGVKLLPGQRFVRKVAKYYKQAKRGTARTGASVKIKDVTTGEMIQELLGLKSKERADIFAETNKQYKDKNYYKDKVWRYKKDLREAWVDKDYEEFNEILSDALKNDPLIGYDVAQSIPYLPLLEIPLIERMPVLERNPELKMYLMQEMMKR